MNQSALTGSVTIDTSSGTRRWEKLSKAMLAAIVAQADAAVMGMLTFKTSSGPTEALTVDIADHFFNLPIRVTEERVGDKIRYETSSPDRSFVFTVELDAPVGRLGEKEYRYLRESTITALFEYLEDELE